MGTTKTINGAQYNFFINYAPGKVNDLFLTAYTVSSEIELVTDVFLSEDTTVANFSY